MSEYQEDQNEYHEQVEDQELSPVEEPVRSKITEKQRQARLKNLEKGRKKRAANIAKRKALRDRAPAYDSESEADESGSESESDDEYVLTRKSAVKKKKIPKKTRNDDYMTERMNRMEENYMKLISKLSRAKHKPSVEKHTHIEIPMGHGQMRVPTPAVAKMPTIAESKRNGILLNL